MKFYNNSLRSIRFAPDNGVGTGGSPAGDSAGDKGVSPKGASASDTKNTDDKGSAENDVKIPDDLKDVIAKQIREATEGVSKDWQSKFDQKNTELQKAMKALEDERKKSMTAEEIAVAERTKKEQEIAEKEKSVIELQRKIWKQDALQTAKLPGELSAFLNGENEVEIKNNTEVLNKYINSIADSRIIEKLKTGYQPAGASQGTNTPIEKRFENF